MEKTSAKETTRSSPINLSAVPEHIRNKNIWVTEWEKHPIRPERFDTALVGTERQPTFYMRWKAPKYTCNWKPLHVVEKEIQHYPYKFYPGFFLEKNYTAVLFIDKDGSKQPFSVSPEDESLIRRCRTYAEYSMHGSIHIYGELTEEHVELFNGESQSVGGGYELYIDDRNCVFTGNRIPCSDPEIKPVPLDVLKELLAITTNGKGVRRTRTETGDRIPYEGLPIEISKGSRHNELVRYAGHLVGTRVPSEASLQLLSETNEKRCKPPLDKSRMEAVFKAFDTFMSEREENEESPDPDEDPGEDYTRFALISADSKGKVKTTLNRRAFSDYLCLKYHTVAFNNRVWIYKDGQYFQDKHTIQSEVERVCAELGLQNQKQNLMEIIVMLLGKNTFEGYPFNKHPNAVPVENGVLLFDFEKQRVELVDHSPEYMFTFQIPVGYDPRAETASVRETLNQWQDGREHEALIQIPAMSLMQMLQDAVYKKSTILQGEYNSGKSTYINLLKIFFGEENYSEVSLHRIAEDRFANGGLEDRLINVFDDLSSVPLEEVGLFKALTGKTHHSVERKHQDSYNGRVFCTHVFACNTPPFLPREVKEDAAFWERWIYLRFEGQFEQDPSFEERTFTPEFLSGFLNLVVEAMLHMKTHGLIYKQDTEIVQERWTVESDPLYQCLEEEFTKTNVERHYGKEKIFAIYKEWCEENEIPIRKQIKTIENFSRSIQAYGFLPDKKRMPGHKHPLNCYTARWEPRYTTIVVLEPSPSSQLA